MTDNTRAVTCLFRQGSYQYNLLIELSHFILTYNFRNKITLLPKCIGRELNVLADQGPSCFPSLRSGYLDRLSFSWLLDLTSRYGVPKPPVDIFVTHHNSL